MNENTKNRSHRGRLAQETLEIVARGWYEAADGRRIEISEHVAGCLEATRLYTPDRLVRIDGTGGSQLHVHEN